MFANYAMNLEGPNNVRDLGGYSTLDGKYTKKGQFLRGDNPALITVKDCEDLYHYGVRAQIDLRSGYECDKAPSGLIGYKDVKYHHFAMLDNINSNPGDAKIPDSMSEIYINLLENKQESFRDIFRLILQYPEACVFFNCTAGRDRTGVMALLILKLANCSNDTIIADYLATDWNIRVELQEMLEEVKKYCADAKNPMKEPRLAIEETLQFFDKTYGTADNYFLQIGLSEPEIAGVKRKIVEQRAES